MATRDVTVRVKANIGSFQRNMAMVGASAKAAAATATTAGGTMATGLGKMEQVAANNQRAWSMTSTAMVAGGAAIVGGLALATKAAIDWESSWIGVQKTVSGTPAQLGKVEDGLRGLARVLPSTHTEIAAVAQAAGQLGIATPDVVDFTKTMIDLGETTNLSAEEAATSIARFSNVMGTSSDDADRLGSALVGLGNNYATTESEIMQMGMRLTGVGAQMDLSEGEVLGLATAMSSVGIEAQAGGTAMSISMKRIGTAVDEGGSSLSTFAETAGMSSEEFASAWEDDAAGALVAFVEGLHTAGEEGESVNAILTELGITGIREADAMLRLSSASGLLGDAMAQGNREFENNNALLDEATLRYESTESKIKAAFSSIKDAAIDFGAVLLPVVAGIAEGAAGLATVFGKIPGPIKTFLVAASGIVGVTLLATGAVMKMIPGITALAGGFKAIATAGVGAAVGIRGVGTAAATSSVGVSRLGKAFGVMSKALGIITVLALVGPTIGSMIPSGALSDVDDMGDALKRIGEDGKEASAGLSDLNEMFTGSGWFTGLDMSGLEDAFRVMENPNVADNIDNIVSKTLTLGGRGSTNIEFAKKNFEQLDAQLASMATDGNAEEAASAYEQLAESAKNAGVGTEGLLEIFPAYTGALEEASSETEAVAKKAELMGAAMGVSVPVTDDMVEALGELGVSADGTVTSVDKLVAALFGMSDGTLDVRAATRAAADGFRAMEESIVENGKSLDENTEKGSANQASLDSYVGALKAKTTAIASAVDENGALKNSDQEVKASLEENYTATLKAVEGFGITGQAAKDLTRELLGIPDDVSIETWMDDFAEKRANDITGAVNNIPDYKDVKVIITDNGSVKVTADQIQSIKDRTINTQVTDNGTISTVQGGINNIEGKTEMIIVTDDGTAHTVQEQINSVSGKTEYVYVDDDGTTHVVQGQIDGVKDGSATVNVSDGGSISFIQRAINQIHGTDVAVNIRKKLYQTKFVDTIKLPQKQYGGRLPGLAGGGTPEGGRLPRTGLGTDQILGVNRDGIPTARVNDREWVVNDKSSDKYDALLGMINRDDPGLESLQALAGGGRVDWAIQQRESARSKVRGARAELTNAKRGARRNPDSNAAEKREKRAEKARDAAQQLFDDAAGRVRDLQMDSFDLRRDLKRGKIADQFSSGSGMSAVDEMFTKSRDKNLSGYQRKSIRKMAFKTEKALLSLEKRSDSLTNKLEKATEKRDELLSVRDSVASNLRGEFSIGGALTQHAEYSTAPATAAGLAADATAQASKIKAFARKLTKLRKKGYPSSVVQEIAELGSLKGSAAADVLLAGTATDVKAFKAAYKDLDAAASVAGQYVTQSMYRGGLDAADGLVRGIEKRQGDVESSFYKMGKGAEKAFKRSLGIKSPSTVMAARADDTADGLVNQLGRRTTDVQKAMGKMSSAGVPVEVGSGSVPVSREVSGHAASAAPVYVQNPFTGEFLLAEVGKKAVQAVPAAANQTIRRNDFGGVYKGSY